MRIFDVLIFVVFIKFFNHTAVIFYRKQNAEIVIFGILPQKVISQQGMIAVNIRIFQLVNGFLKASDVVEQNGSPCHSDEL